MFHNQRGGVQRVPRLDGRHRDPPTRWSEVIRILDVLNALDLLATVTEIQNISRAFYLSFLGVSRALSEISWSMKSSPRNLSRAWRTLDAPRPFGPLERNVGSIERVSKSLAGVLRVIPESSESVKR